MAAEEPLCISAQPESSPEARTATSSATRPNIAPMRSLERFADGLADCPGWRISPQPAYPAGGLLNRWHTRLGKRTRWSLVWPPNRAEGEDG